MRRGCKGWLAKSSASAVVNGLLEAGEGGPTGERRLLGQPAADQLHLGILPQGVGNILVCVATGDQVEALAQQQEEGMRDRADAPVGDGEGPEGAQPSASQTSPPSEVSWGPSERAARGTDVGA